MSKQWVVWAVGLMGMAVSLPFLIVGLLPLVTSLREEEFDLGLLLFMLPTFLPALFTFYNSYQLTRRSSKDNIKWTIGCLCVLLVMLTTSAWLSFFPESDFELLLPWCYLASTILGILLYATASRNLLQFEGFETRYCELLGGGQLGLVAFFVWLALSSINENPIDDSGFILALSFIGPIVAAVAFYRVSSRILVNLQRSSHVQAS